VAPNARVEAGMALTAKRNAAKNRKIGFNKSASPVACVWNRHRAADWMYGPDYKPTMRAIACEPAHWSCDYLMP
jgi:hypothetical protein